MWGLPVFCTREAIFRCLPQAHAIFAPSPALYRLPRPYSGPPRYKARVKGKGDYVALKKIKLEAEDEGKILSNAPTPFLTLQLSRCHAAGAAF